LGLNGNRKKSLSLLNTYRVIDKSNPQVQKILDGNPGLLNYKGTKLEDFIKVFRGTIVSKKVRDANVDNE
jgi:hypothetical protein